VPCHRIAVEEPSWLFAIEERCKAFSSAIIVSNHHITIAVANTLSCSLVEKEVGVVVPVKLAF